ncbi:MAG: alkaline phosphatase family protein [Halorhabdus sp.]
MTLCIIALDGADENLVDLDLFTQSGALETFTYSMDYPYTGVVWPTVATGLHPREHGVTEKTESEWSNPVLQFGSWAMNILDMSGELRRQLGDTIEENTGASWDLAEPDAPTFFDADGRYVHNWPGVHRTEELQRIWSWFRETNKKGMSTDEFMRRARPTAAAKFGWLEEAVQSDAALVGAHVHILDVVGHLFTDDEQQVQQMYHWAEDQIREIRWQMGPDDELVVLSDHGIECTWLGDESGGGHSMRAYFGTTLDTRPASVFGVREWVEDHVPEWDVQEENASLPEEQLRDLGYIE